MKRFVPALPVLIMLLSTTLGAQQAPPEIPFDSVPNFFKLPPDMNFGEVGGVAVNSKGHIFVFTRVQQRQRPGVRCDRVAAARVRPRRQVRPRDRQGPLRVVLRARGPHRQGRQHLGGRQRVGHGRQVQPGGPCRDGVRPEEGSVGRSGGRGRTSPRRGRRSTASSASPPTSRGTCRATSSSATATSTRAWRSTTRTATG